MRIGAIFEDRDLDREVAVGQEAAAVWTLSGLVALRFALFGFLGSLAAGREGQDEKQRRCGGAYR
jgi:hypothetical protein